MRRASAGVISAFLAVCLCGCSRNETAIAQGPPESAEAAINAFQAQALSCLPENLPAESRSIVVAAINDRDHLHARQTTCEACFQRMDGTLMEKERQQLILFGAIDDLRNHPGDCWEIMSFGGFGNGIEGYIDATTGELLVFWIVPEG